MDKRVLEAKAEAVGCVSRLQIGGWDSYLLNNDILTEAEAALKSPASKTLMDIWLEAIEKIF